MNREDIANFRAEQNPKVHTLVDLMSEVWETKDTPTKIIKGANYHTLIQIIKSYHEREQIELETLLLADQFSQAKDVLKRFVQGEEVGLLLTEYEKVTAGSPGTKIFGFLHELTGGRSTQEFCAKLNVKLPPVLVCHDPEILADLSRAFFVMLLEEYS